MTASMVLLKLQILAMPLAFAAMLIGSLILFRRTRRRHFAVQAVGFGMLVASQASMFLSYQLFPAVIGSDGGLMANAPRDTMFVAELILNIAGFALCAVGYVLQVLRHGDAPNNSFKPKPLRGSA